LVYFLEVFMVCSLLYINSMELYRKIVVNTLHYIG